MEFKRSHGMRLALFVFVTYSFPAYALAPEKPVSRVDIPGYASAMEQSPDGRWVYVIVENKDESGIYILDARIPSRPTIAYKLKLNFPTRMRLTRDGRNLYVLTRAGTDEVSKQAAGLYLFDLADPANPRKVQFSQSSSVFLATSYDDKILAIDVRQEGKGKAVRLYDMTNRTALNVLADIPLRQECSTYGEVELQRIVLGAEPPRMFLSYRNGPHFRVATDCVLYDLSMPSRPTPLTINLNFLAASGGNVFHYTYNIGTWVPDVRTLFSIHRSMTDDQSEPKNALSNLYLFPEGGHSGHSMFVQESISRVVIGPGYSKEPGKWKIVDVTDPKSPQILEEHILVAQEYPVSAQLTKDLRYLYLTGKDGILIFSMVGGSDVQAIVKAHEEVLREYRYTKIPESDSRKFAALVARLEKAGIAALRQGAPAGMATVTRASILNDYAYFMRLSGKPVESLDILDRVVGIQPERAVAHLNMAEAYRDSITPNSSIGAIEDVRNKIALHYRKYQQLTKRSIPEFDTLVSAHLSKNRPTVCQYLADHVNRGKLDQVTIPPGWMDINNDGKYERTALGHGMGTMGGEVWSVYDGNGNSINLTSNESDSGQMTFGVKFTAYAGSYYILNLKNERSAAIQSVEHMTSDNRVETVCSFTQEMVETIAEAKKPGLCKAALEGKLQYVSFDKTHGLTIERLGRWASAPGAAAVVDIDNDGISENLLEIGYMSSAGRGCDFTYLDMLNAYRSDFENSPKRQLLLSAEGVTPGGNTGHTGVPACGNSRYRVFKYEGKYYLEGKYGVGNLSTSDVQFHNVVLIDQGAVHSICKFKFQTINK